jgi:probable HAF family extracellular repeat protein
MFNKKGKSIRLGFSYILSGAVILALLLFAFSSIGATPGAYARVRATRTPRPTRTPTPTPTPGGAAYTITAIGIQANGINASGEVTGILNNAHAFLWMPSSPNGTSGRVFDLGTLGGSVSVGYSLNDSGQVTGYSTLSNGSYRAFLFSQRSMVDLGILEGNYSTGYGINAGGQVTGSGYVSSDEHAMLWTPDAPNGTSGTMVDLGTLGGEYSSARAINLSGQVVGYSYLPDWNFRAFLDTGGVMTDLGTLGGDFSKAYGINDAGQVVGEAYISGNLGSHAFLWQNGVMTDLGLLPGGNYAAAYSLTPDGQEIVGESTVPGGQYLVYHAFVYSNSQMLDLNNLIPANSGWVLSQASGVNAAGQIVGYGTLNGLQSGFLLTPVH